MGKYDDIINLPRHVSQTHAHMPAAERAAQFSSFAALSGYEDAVAESGRLTAARTEQGIDAIEELDEKLRLINDGAARGETTLTYFVPDAKKDGGSYAVLRGRVKRIDPVEAVLIMEDGRRIPLADILDIELGAESERE